MKKVYWIIFGWVALVISTCANANDSTVRVGAGGLTLLKNDDIQMLSETLEISTSKIKVTYHFLNTSNKDIKTTVAFPMPAFNGAAYHLDGDVYVHQRPLDSFKISVNGEVVPVNKSRVFLIDNVDATDKLRKIGLSDKQIFDSEFSCFIDTVSAEPASVDCQLTERQRKAIHGLYTDDSPWLIQETAYWKQTFPAGKAIEVVHEYKPFVGDVNSVDIPADGCPDEGSRQAINRRVKASNRNDIWQDILPLGSTKDVEYILGTGRNWKGSIRDFRLIIKKDSDDQILSLCFPGKAKKIAHDMIEFHQTNYTPQDKLIIYFVDVRK